MFDLTLWDGGGGWRQLVKNGVGGGVRGKQEMGWIDLERGRLKVFHQLFLLCYECFAIKRPLSNG